MERAVLEISWGSLWRVFLFVAFVAILYLTRQIVLGLFLALVISSGLDFIVDFLERKGIPRTLGVILIFLLSILALILLVYTVIPYLIVDLNTILGTFSEQTTANFWFVPLLDLETTQSLTLFINQLSQQFFSGNASPLDAFSQVLGNIALAISVFVSSFYLSLNRDGIERFIKAVMPTDSEATALRIYERSRRKIGLWFRTQLLINVIIGVLVWAALSILGVRHAFLLGLLAGIFELVPFVGPIFAGGIAVLTAFTTSPSLAISTLIVFLAIHQFEAHILVPVMNKRAVGLHPVIVIAALLMGAEVAGFLGIIIAVPAAAVFQEILEDRSFRKLENAG